VTVIDTGVLVALANSKDHHYERCARWFDNARGPLLVPQPVIAEAGYLICKYLGPAVEAAFLESLGPVGPFTLAPLVSADLPRMAELVRKYADLPLGTTDSAVIALAERHKDYDIATLDRRHFSVVRDRRGEPFRILPE